MRSRSRGASLAQSFWLCLGSIRSPMPPVPRLIIESCMPRVGLFRLIPPRAAWAFFSSSAIKESRSRTMTFCCVCTGAPVTVLARSSATSVIFPEIPAIVGRCAGAGGSWAIARGLGQNAKAITPKRQRVAFIESSILVRKEVMLDLSKGISSIDLARSGVELGNLGTLEPARELGERIADLLLGGSQPFDLAPQGGGHDRLPGPAVVDFARVVVEPALDQSDHLELGDHAIQLALEPPGVAGQRCARRRRARGRQPAHGFRQGQQVLLDALLQRDRARGGI